MLRYEPYGRKSEFAAWPHAYLPKVYRQEGEDACSLMSRLEVSPRPSLHIDLHEVRCPASPSLFSTCLRSFGTLDLVECAIIAFRKDGWRGSFIRHIPTFIPSVRCLVIKCEEDDNGIPALAYIKRTLEVTDEDVPLRRL